MKRLLAVSAVVVASAMTQAQFGGSLNSVPAFHDQSPAKGDVLPAILSQKQLADAGLTEAAQKESYKAAIRTSAIAYQLPCYCYCDRNHGHKSLRSCFESTHGANCGTCMAEVLYAYKMSKKGWTAKMIRDGIMRGDYKQMDLQHPDPVL
ncbi:MAG TPA: CYCXC family (seleno)protein [Alphaproteobacteria bacterium]|nr:CYCXC family (seleno)protein [Alphaproteobacteria bacterium]